MIARIQLIPDMEYLSAAESKLESAQINLRNAKLDDERQKKLYDDDLIGELAFSKFELNYELQQEAVDSAEEIVALILSVGAIPGQSFNANLEYVSPKGMDDQGTIKFEIKAAVKVQDELFLRAGYSANADIVLDRRDQVLVINEGNLITENGKTFVEVETGPQEFERKEIETGLSDGINIEVLAGVTEQTKFKKLAQ